MSATATLSDPTLLADIRRYGKFDTSGCYQCGSCTLSCELVGDHATFPRRTLRYALLGLRSPLLAGLDPWVCHDCGDCSLICPRQAEPRISMMTVRSFLTAQYDWTGLAGKILRSRIWHLVSLAVAALLTLALIVLYHLWYVELGFGDFVHTEMPLDHMFPTMTYYTLVVILLPFLILLSHAARMWWLTMRPSGPEKVPITAYVAEAWTYLYQSVTQARMRKCPDSGRWLGHWVLALGTAMMLTIKVFALRWFQAAEFYPFYHPQRWLGYLAAGFIVYGIGTILTGHLRAKKEFYKETRLEDLIFPILLLLTALSGLAVHISRYLGFGLTCHFLYALHIVIATPMLLIEMSFGKWSHMVYRPLALYFQAVRERAGQAMPAEEAVSHAA